jgi:hypothetical protein
MWSGASSKISTVQLRLTKAKAVKMKFKDLLAKYKDDKKKSFDQRSRFRRNQGHDHRGAGGLYRLQTPSSQEREEFRQRKAK